MDTTDAINEFIDNSFDANADNIWITVQKNDRGGLTLIVEDDGEGIQPDDLVEVLKFGGKVDRDRETTGKFGFGLPSSAFCQADRTEIYSKVEGQPFYFNRLDVDELGRMDDVLIPDEQQRQPPSKDFDFHLDEQTESGTIILIPHLRSPDRKRPDSLVEYIENNVSQVQREILADGREIYLNDELVQVHDPTIRIDNSEEVNLLGEKSENWGDPFVFEFPEVEHKGSEPPKVTVELFKLPIDEIIRRNAEDKLEIGQQKQGFYIVRENREIGSALSLSLFTKHNDLNYFRARIHFPSELDHLFGVQTNKSRFSLDNELRSQLEEALAPQFRQLRDTISSERQSAITRYREKNVGQTQAEKTASNRNSVLPRSSYDPDESEVQEQIDEAERQLEKLSDRDDLTDEQKSQLEDELTQIIDGDQFFKINIEPPRSGNFYDVMWFGKEIRVLINPNHLFYEKFYKHLDNGIDGSDPELDATDVKKYVDLLLMSMAKAEDVSYQNERIKKFYERQRRHWTSFIQEFYEGDDEFIEP
ncbi:ATP-binding protein [Haloferax mucosum]|nr:ATP-binding protein [Haloferax mucosum]